MITLSFTVPGTPVPKGRPRVARGRAYTPEKTRAYEKTVALMASSVMARTKTKVFSGQVRVKCTFALPTKRRVDLDNLIKSLMDGLNGIAYADDSQVMRVDAEKVFTDATDGFTSVQLFGVAA